MNISNNTLTSILLIAFCLLQAMSCNNVKELEYKGIKNTQLQTLSLNNTALQINLEYYNPNTFGIDVKQTNLNVYLNDKFVGIADQPSKTQIPKQANFLFPVVVHFNPLKILGTAFGALTQKTNKLTVQGSAKVGKGGVYITVPVNVTEPIELR